MLLLGEASVIPTEKEKENMICVIGDAIEKAEELGLDWAVALQTDLKSSLRWLAGIAKSCNIRSIVIHQKTLTLANLKMVSKIRRMFPQLPIFVLKNGQSSLFRLFEKNTCDGWIRDAGHLKDTLRKVLALQNKALARLNLSSSMYDALRPICAVMHRNRIKRMHALKSVATLPLISPILSVLRESGALQPAV